MTTVFPHKNRRNSGVVSDFDANGGGPEVHLPTATTLLDRAATPSNAQRALKEVIVAMAGDAIREGAAARAECERLDDTLKLLQDHISRLVEDYDMRIRTVQEMYRRQREQAIQAQRALYSAPLAPPVPPSDLILETIHPRHEETGHD